MQGSATNRGVNTRALDELFQLSSARAPEVQDTISVSILEIYNESIRDLLTDGVNARKLEVRLTHYCYWEYC
jgi:kinesin family member C2/C3